MKIENISKNGKIEAVFSKESDWNLFDRIADFIAEEFNGHWLEKVDGFDQRYWDIEIENAILTLHLEHYLGISLFPARENDAAANNLVRKIGDYHEANFL